MCASVLYVPYIADDVLSGRDPDYITTLIHSVPPPRGDIIPYDYYSVHNLPANYLLSTQATRMSKAIRIIVEEENTVFKSCKLKAMLGQNM